MPIQQIHAFLVSPGKARREKIAVSGTAVPLSGNLFKLLNGIYERSEEECDIHINFRPTSEGEQKNEFRSLLVKYLSDLSIPSAQTIAERLQDMTDRRSGLGLLFLISGREADQHKIVISRFPTDSAILVDEKSTEFTVEFLERVFMKNKTSYKAALYNDSSLKRGFWRGKAVDRQISNGNDHLSDYWIRNFLMSEFVTTAAAGSRRLGIALRDAVKKAPMEVKEELIAASRLARGLGGQSISIIGFAERFNLSKEARGALISELKNPEIANEVFQLDVAEFGNFVAYRSVELDNGALMTAKASEFEKIFDKKYEDGSKKNVVYTTKGKVIDDKLKSQR
ncbi:MAG: hypothetical protein AB7N54_18810 [Alphaproteobacteria bacterium]